MNKPVVVEIVIWCLILTIVFSIGIFSYSKFFLEPNVYNIEFKDIDGITKGSPVRFMGINIGYVKALKPKDKHINVQIVVTERNMKIPNGTVARVEFYGLGGSKSIELMPADSKGANGIVSVSTLRLHDMVVKSESLVEILEMIEKTVKGVNKSAVQKMLEEISDIKDSQIKEINTDLSDIKMNIIEKTENIKHKQSDITKKIDGVNKMVDKFNKFIKK